MQIPNAADDPVVAMAFNRDGCRKLQSELHRKGITMVDKVVAAFHENLSLLLTDQYGNYLFQRLVETATSQQRATIVGSGALLRYR